MVKKIDTGASPLLQTGGKLFGQDAGNSPGYLDPDSLSKVYDLTLPPQLFSTTGTLAKLNLLNSLNVLSTPGAYWDMSGHTSGLFKAAGLSIVAPTFIDNQKTVKIRQKNCNGEVLKTDSIKITVASPVAVVAKNILIFGDSTIYGGGIVTQIGVKQLADTNLTLTFIGTVGTTYKYEARGGSTFWDWMRNPATAFYSEDGFEAGFGAYCDAHGVPDIIISKLGINGRYNQLNDAAVIAINTLDISYMHEMVSGFKAKNSNVIIGFDCIGGPSSQDLVGSDYGMISADRIRRNFQIFNEAILEEDFGTNVHILHGNLAITTPENFDNGLHPAAGGYIEIGNMYYAWIKNMVGPTTVTDQQYLDWHDIQSDDTAPRATKNWGTGTGNVLTGIYSSGSQPGVGLKFTASTKGIYQGYLAYTAKAINGVTTFGILLWKNGAVVSYDLAEPKSGDLTDFSGNENILQLPLNNDTNVHEFNFDLSDAPDFDQITICAAAYNSPPGAGDWFDIDISQSGLRLFSW